MKRLFASLLLLVITASCTGCGAKSAFSIDFTKAGPGMTGIIAALLILILACAIALFVRTTRMRKNLEKTVQNRTMELERQSMTLSTIYASIPDLLFCKDANSVYTSCNHSFEKLTGMPMAELVGKTDKEIYGMDEKLADRFRQDDQDIMKGRRPKVIEEVIVYPDGTACTVETAKIPLMSERGECVGLVGISRDITGRKAMEDTLKITLDNLDTCIYINEIETGKILFINKKMVEEFGGGPFTGEVCWKVLQDGFKEQCSFCPMPKLMESGDDYYIWDEHNTVTGRHYRNTDSLIRWSDGKLVHMQHSVDVTGSVMLQRQLEQTIEKLRVVVKNYSGVIWSVDEDRNITLFDGLHLEQMGVSSFALEGHPVTAPAVKDMGLGIAEMTEKTFAEGPQDCIIEARGRVFQTHTSPIKDKQSHIMGIVGNTVDVTEMMKLQQELEQASKAKGDFLSRMSHEMRTPMNAIIGMTKIADASNDVDKLKYCLSTIHSSSSHLLGIINDILDMSKIEAGKFELDPVPFNIEKMLMKICNLVIDKTEQKKQTLAINIGKNMHLHYVGDELRLSQVITNLLSNAVKFTPEEGKITLFVEEIETAGDFATLHFQVSDTGIGMTREQIDRLFTSFEQADGSISRRYGGTGLGLAISKSIVEKMNGRIRVGSETGKGSTFLFDVRVGRSLEHRSRTIFGGITASDLKLLVVDDSRNIREQFLAIMNNFEIACDEADSGEAAISLVGQAHADQRPYDVIFLDADMPGMNGMETVKRLSGLIDKNTVIVMMSLSDSAELEASAKNAGIDRFMTKILFPSTILDMINEVIGKTVKSLDMRSSSAREKPDFSNVSVLLVEDVAINREIFMALLEETKLQIDIAENGLEAVQKYCENPDKYNMIIMDIQMPEMDGYEATRTIRALNEHSAKVIPIIAMTANAFKEDIEKCMESGMNDHISKPIDVEMVMQKIWEYGHSR